MSVLSRSQYPLLAASVLVALATFAGVRDLGRGPVRIEVGGYDRAVLAGEWPRALRADLGPEDAGGGATSLYFRALPWAAKMRTPLEAAGPVAVSLRATTRIRSGITVSRGAHRASEIVVPAGRFDRVPGPWAAYRIELPPTMEPTAVDLGIVARPLPLVRRAPEDLAHPKLYVDHIDIEAAEGLHLAPRVARAAAAVPLAFFAFLLAVRLSPLAAWAGSAIAALMTVAALRAAPVAAATAIPRLLPLALGAGFIAFVIVRRAGGERASPREAGLVAALTAAGTLFHAAVVFFPNHNPPDIDIHVRRTLDLEGVPLEYGALLRYGSQLPTASQDLGAATAALGERTLIPYSPLPYVVYLGLHALGLDLFWAMTAFNAAFAMLVVPFVWYVAAFVWGRWAAWTGAVLYTLDLAVWHHLGRSHAPAVLGGAFGTVALVHLIARAEDLGSSRAVAGAALLLALGALGYSSMPVLLGLFGSVLLVLLTVDAGGVEAAPRRGLAGALVLGGLAAGVLFYFHYVPGLLRGAAGIEAEPDAFPGRTFFIFHNESRQSLRLWALGLWMPFAAGIAAAPFALRAARPSARPLLVAWLAAWALVMLLKEPFLLPRLLRWAKEDQFVSPLLALMLAGALGAIPARGLRWAATAAVVAAFLWLQLRDFAHHAVSLRL